MDDDATQQNWELWKKIIFNGQNDMFCVSCVEFEVQEQLGIWVYSSKAKSPD